MRLNGRQIAEILGVDENTVSRWAKKPELKFPVAESTGKNTEKAYDVNACVMWWHNRELAKMGGIVDGTIINLQDERARKTKEEADHMALKNNILRQEHSPNALLVDALAAFVGQIVAVVGSIPARLKQRNPNIPAADIEAATQELFKVMDNASKISIYDDGLQDEPESDREEGSGLTETQRAAIDS